ncbi:MAG TPA: sodium:solute symporter family protein, partial [Candidatus Marinimicrobia bacterium]|nr:sodium:solute symporter family protein [Candidatus Neomarinimicrobiota bacterium]
MDTQPLLSTGGMIYMGLYLFSLIGIGLAGRFARKENTMADFYLAGRGMGVFVLFLTLYATQYSGNTLIGFTGRAYREGFTALVTVTFMTVIIGAYLIFAPKLYRLSKKHKYITVGDFIQHRFQSTTLTVTITVIAIIALGNYILTNLKAIGFIIVAATGGQVSFAQGIIVLSLIMVIYETLGGMRSVAWTDMIQGVLLLLGVFFIFITIQSEYGGLAKASEQIKNIRPDFWQPPDWGEKRLWLSTIIIVFFGISVYPHAIQRIYAARDERTLRRSFQIMIFMPLVTTLFMIIVGIVGAAQIPGLDRQGSEQITLLLLNDLAQKIPAISWLLVIFLSAAVAAIMSTVDSALLAISSLVTQDLYGKVKPESSQSHLTGVGKFVSWIIMAGVVWLAIALPQTIWRLFEIKLELLCQIAPAIFLGIHLKSLSAKSILTGILLGTAVALFIMIG